MALIANISSRIPTAGLLARARSAVRTSEAVAMPRRRRRAHTLTGIGTALQRLARSSVFRDVGRSRSAQLDGIGLNRRALGRLHPTGNIVERVADLCEEIAPYNLSANVELVWTAAVLAAECHRGQKRKLGEPYFEHPLRVAEILVKEQKIYDVEMIIAAFLHDLVEDTTISIDTVREIFGDGVAHIVDGLTKLRTQDKEESLALTYRKFIRQMRKDPRIAIAKFADRKDNLITMVVRDESGKIIKRAFRDEKVERIAKETLQVYVPIARALGMDKIANELEDLAFELYMPGEFEAVKMEVAKQRAENKNTFAEATANLTLAVRKRFPGAVVRRAPMTYWQHSEYYRGRGTRPQDLFVIHNLEVLVPRPEDCYTVLYPIHSTYPPHRNLVRARVAASRRGKLKQENSVWLGVEGVGVLRVKVLTERMRWINDYGILTVPRYQWEDYLKVFFSRLGEEMREAGLDSGEIVGAIGNAATGIMVKSRKMRDYPLRPDATLYDFAFAIHGQIGLAAESAEVNGELVTDLSKKARDRSIVWINTGKNVVPPLKRYEETVMPKSHQRLRGYFSRYLVPKEEVVDVVNAEGRVIIEAALNTELEPYLLTVRDLGRFMKSVQNPLEAARWKDRFFERINLLVRGMKVEDEESLRVAILLGRVHLSSVAEVFKEVLDARLRNEIASRRGRREQPRKLFVSVAAKDRRGLTAEIAEGITRAGLGITAHSSYIDPATGIATLQYEIDIEWSTHISQVLNHLGCFGTVRHRNIVNPNILKEPIVLADFTQRWKEADSAGLDGEA